MGTEVQAVGEIEQLAGSCLVGLEETETTEMLGGGWGIGPGRKE
jgi:hypothetical protein